MKISQSEAGWCLVVALTLGFLLSGAPATAQTAFGTGAFAKVSAIETQLKRGVSTKADVQRILGVPSGSGGAMLPGYGERSEHVEPYQIWYYEDIEITDMKSENGVMNMKMRQQILAVFFKGEVFHGFFWTSNSGTAQAGRQH